MALLEGLEISIKFLKEVKVDNPTLRYDSEYFEKQYTNIFSVLEKNKCDKISNVINWVTQGPNPQFTEDGTIPCLTGRNISKGRVNYNNADYLNEYEYNNLNRFQIKPGDTLVTLKGKGSIGKIGYVTENIKAVFSRDVGLIRPDRIDSAYLNAYVLSSYGQKLVLRGETGGTGQTTLTTTYLKDIPIPRFSFEAKIGILVKNSELILNMSLEIYSQAETLLLETLGLKDFEINSEAVNVKGFKESFLSTGRLDAEYYQKKYENYLELVSSYSNGYALLQIACNLKDNNYNPIEHKEYRYIELSDIGKSGDITGCTDALGEELPTRARRKVNTNDVIISSIEGSLESCALVTEEYNNALCSTGFYVINSNKINSETLLVLFKSKLMQSLMKQGCSGTILTAINKNEFQNIPVPLIDKATQTQISELIQESFRLKKESQQLLDLAKHAVEIAIEEGEEKAMQLIEGVRG